MRRRGHPILGAIIGFLLFLFIGIDLVLFGVIETYSNVVSILAIAGIVVGFLWGWWSPIKRARKSTTPYVEEPMPPPPPDAIVDAPPPPG